MAVFCDICNKRLINNYTLRRHKHLIHGIMDDIYNGTETVDSHASSDEDDGSVASTVSSENGETDSSEPEQIERGWRNPFWRKMIKDTLEDMDDLPATIEELKTDQYLAKFIEKLHMHYDAHLFMQEALEESYLDDKLRETENYYKNKLKFSKRESKDTAWPSRKYLFKQLISKNSDIFDLTVQDQQDGMSDDPEHGEPSAIATYYNQVRM